jgi:hypothetical protein
MRQAELLSRNGGSDRHIVCQKSELKRRGFWERTWKPSGVLLRLLVVGRACAASTEGFANILIQSDKSK